MKFIISCSCFLLFAIQTLINGKPYGNSAFHNNDRLENMLQNLPNRLNNYGLQFSHHHAQQPHHPDTDHDNYQHRSDKAKDPKSLSNVEIFNNLLGMKNIARTGDNHDDEADETDLMETFTASRMCKKKPREYNCTKQKCGSKSRTRTSCGKENIDDVLELLADLDKKLQDDSNHKKQSSEVKSLRTGYGKENIDEVLEILEDIDKKIEGDNKYNLKINDADKNQGYRNDDGDAWNRGDRPFKDNTLRCNGDSCGRNTDDKDEKNNRYDGDVYDAIR